MVMVPIECHNGRSEIIIHQFPKLLFGRFHNLLEAWVAFLADLLVGRVPLHGLATYYAVRKIMFLSGKYFKIDLFARVNNNLKSLFYRVSNRTNVAIPRIYILVWMTSRNCRQQSVMKWICVWCFKWRSTKSRRFRYILFDTALFFNSLTLGRVAFILNV